jgi:hypothetical protein
MLPHGHGLGWQEFKAQLRCPRLGCPQLGLPPTGQGPECPKADSRPTWTHTWRLTRPAASMEGRVAGYSTRVKVCRAVTKLSWFLLQEVQLCTTWSPYTLPGLPVLSSKLGLGLSRI